MEGFHDKKVIAIMSIKSSHVVTHLLFTFICVSYICIFCIFIIFCIRSNSVLSTMLLFLY